MSVLYLGFACNWNSRRREACSFSIYPSSANTLMSSMDIFATTTSTSASTVHILDGSLICTFLAMSASSLASLMNDLHLWAGMFGYPVNLPHAHHLFHVRLYLESESRIASTCHTLGDQRSRAIFAVPTVIFPPHPKSVCRPGKQQDNAHGYIGGQNSRVSGSLLLGVNIAWQQCCTVPNSNI
jgi:hypothetical protein